MLDIQGDYANKEHYCISKTKSSVVQFNDKQPRKFTMNSEEIPTSQSAVHLGIERDNSSKFGTKNVSNARISAARKATYALMGAGLHGLNGLNPTVSIHIIRIFIIPRLIHGLEVVRLMISDIKALSSYFKQLLKRIQHLPERTADSATYLLSGQMPIEAEIDKRTLTLFGNIIRNPNTVEFKLAQRQLAIKDRNSKSWFTYVQQLLEKYNLPCSSVLLQEPPGKFSWKNLVYKAVKTYWTNKIHSDAREKSSLQYINFEQLTFDNPHLVWKSAKFEYFSIQRAGIKCRLMLDTYLLQIHKQKFNKYEVDSTCLLCQNGAEDRKHFLIQCVALDSIRSPFLKTLHEKTTEVVKDVNLTDAIFEQSDKLLSLILDCTGYQVIPPSRQEEFEAVSRGLCFALHIARSDRIKSLQ
ncbi:unnamed protein product [Mytilus edulis]|uniref:Reverse transcriptase zinc-binding domain-containing protein n=1 Tax=Mytilus edulis TaxID=6550 RepID=A0A8S3PV20_MYTED|nr:unnamed protein product [Mytilus edulis]